MPLRNEFPKKIKNELWSTHQVNNWCIATACSQHRLCISVCIGKSYILITVNIFRPWCYALANFCQSDYARTHSEHLDLSKALFHSVCSCLEPTFLLCYAFYKVRDGHITVVPNNDPGDPRWEGFHFTPAMTEIGCSISNQAAWLTNHWSQPLPLIYILNLDTRCQFNQISWHFIPIMHVFFNLTSFLKGSMRDVIAGYLLIRPSYMSTNSSGDLWQPDITSYFPRD